MCLNLFLPCYFVLLSFLCCFFFPTLPLTWYNFGGHNSVCKKFWWSSHLMVFVSLEISSGMGVFLKFYTALWISKHWEKSVFAFKLKLLLRFSIIYMDISVLSLLITVCTMSENVVVTYITWCKPLGFFSFSSSKPYTQSLCPAFRPLHCADATRLVGESHNLGGFLRVVCCYTGKSTSQISKGRTWFE